MRFLPPNQQRQSTESINAEAKMPYVSVSSLHLTCSSLSVEVHLVNLFSVHYERFSSAA